MANSLDWATKIVELVKHSTKMIIILWISSGVCFLLPESWFQRIDIWNLIVSIRPYIGAVFGITTVCLAVETGYMIKDWGHTLLKKLKQSKKQQQLKGSILRELQGLHEDQYAILREFYFQKQDAIPLPIEHYLVIQLIEKHILIKTSFPIRRVHLIGKVGYFKIADHIKSEISPEMVGYPIHEVSRQEMEELNRRRPEFARALEQWKQLGI